MIKKKYWMGAKKAPAQDRFFIGALDPDLWECGDKDDWDACWHTGMPAAGVYRQMEAGRTVNHIPGNNALTVKSMLYETLSALKARAPAALQDRLNFFPRSYLMPADYHALQTDAFEAPEKQWIIKPKSLSRGRGISVTADAGTAPNDSKQLVQEYLSAPHLYDGHKYVLRCYMAITSVEPLRVYLYKDGFVKLASEPYQIGDFDNLYVHLTNPDVNALNEAAGASVVFYSFDEYRHWLSAQGKNAEPVFRGLKEIAAIAAIGARNVMRRRLDAAGAFAPGCYELIGMDCMVDANLKPWLLECNLSPSLDVYAETGGDMETDVKRGVVADLVSMLRLNDPAFVHADPEDTPAIIAESEAELARAGRYEQVFPGETPHQFFPFFPAPRYADVALAGAINAAGTGYRPQTNADLETAFGEELALYAETTGKLASPTAAGGYIWLRAAAGDAPKDIAEDLEGFMPDTERNESAALRAVWETLADWGTEGLVRAPGDIGPARDASRSEDSEWIGEARFVFGEARCRIRWTAPEIERRLAPLVGALRSDSVNDFEMDFSVIRARAGYALLEGPRLIAVNVKLSEIASRLRFCLIERFARDRDARPLAASLWGVGDQTFVFASLARGRWDALAAALAERNDAVLIAGACALDLQTRGVVAIPAPTRRPFEGGPDAGDAVHQWPGETKGLMTPLLAAPTANVLSVDRIVFPVFTDGKENFHAEELHGRKAYASLLKLSLSGHFKTDAARVLSEWLATTSIVEVRFSDVQSAAGDLASYLAARKNENGAS
jgi:tubulin polyglutamylase TTLL5